MTPGVMAPGAPRTPRTRRPRGSFKLAVRQSLREPFTRRNWRECRYAGVSLLVAIPLFAFTAIAVTVGLAVSVSFAGLPLLATALRAFRRLGAFGRRLAGRPPWPRIDQRRHRRRARNRASWAGSGRA
jgi:hypothetical protein